MADMTADSGEERPRNSDTLVAPRKQRGERPDWVLKLKDFEKPDTRKATLQLIDTIIPYLVVLAFMYLTMRMGLPIWVTLLLAVPAGGFLVRLFILFHDCTDGSFLASRPGVRILGTAIGCLTFTPFAEWRHSHGVHHSTACSAPGASPLRRKRNVACARGLPLVRTSSLARLTPPRLVDLANCAQTSFPVAVASRGRHETTCSLVTPVVTRVQPTCKRICPAMSSCSRGAIPFRIRRTSTNSRGSKCVWSFVIDSLLRPVIPRTGKQRCFADPLSLDRPRVFHYSGPCRTKRSFRARWLACSEDAA